MERRLIVMRHAKSPRGGPSTPDKQRPISDKGRREADEIAERLVEHDWVPDLVVSSTALRAVETWEAMQPALPGEISTTTTDALYLAGVQQVHDALVGLDDGIGSVLVMGHNPGWQQVVAYYSGVQQRLTTANAALLHTETASWKEALQAGNFELARVLRPRGR